MSVAVNVEDLVHQCLDEVDDEKSPAQNLKCGHTVSTIRR